MDTTEKRPEDMTWAEVKATFAEAAALSKENEQGLKELRAAIAKTREDLSKSIAETREAEAERSREFDLKMDRMAEEREIAAKERAESLAKLEKSVAETTKGIDKMYKSICGVKEELGGISKSNGMVAEDYFFASLNESKTFGGVHFDIVTQNMKNAIKRKDGSKLEGQYDIVLSNDAAACILEAKYRLREEDVFKLVDKQVDTFKILFPNYANYKIYLAVGGMTVEEEAMNTAKRLGIGVLTVSGDAVVVYDKDLKIY